MKRAWRTGTAPTCTAEVPEFVEKHVHDNYVLTAGGKSLPVHKHLLHVDKPTILRKPPHTVHKVLKGGGGPSSQTTTNRRIRDRISGHPYKHAAAIASARRDTDEPDDDGAEGGRHLPSSSSSPSLFGVAGVIGGPEFDSYQMYRHGIFPFKEQLAHEVNKLVLEKKNLDALRKRAAAAADASRQQQRRGSEDNTTESGSSYNDDGSDTDTLIGDDEEDDCMLSSSSTLIDEDGDVEDIDDDEITD